MRVWSTVPGKARATGQSRGEVDTETLGVNDKRPHPQGPLRVSQLQRG